MMENGCSSKIVRFTITWEKYVISSKKLAPYFSFCKEKFASFFSIKFRWFFSDDNWVKRNEKKNFFVPFFGFPWLSLMYCKTSVSNFRDRFLRTFRFLKMTHLKEITGYYKYYNTRKKFTGKHFCQSLQASETLAQVFSCEFCEIFRSTFFTDYLWTTAFPDDLLIWKLKF